MAYGSINAQVMVGRIRQYKPSLGPQLALSLLNDRIRAVMDYRATWADLLKRAVISIPAAYTTGTVSLAPGSNLVTGIGTGWPVLDAVNTTSTQPVNGAGIQQVALASALGVTSDSYLVFDPGTPSQETVAVLGVTPVTAVNPAGIVTARFSVAHASGVAVQSSSLAGLQFRLGTGYPIFTVRAVRDAVTLELDNQWGGPPITNAAYQILKQYISLGPDVRDIGACVDQVQGVPITVGTSQAQLNAIDPQRGSQENPQCLAAFSPNEQGNMQWELWPAQTSAYQLTVMVFQGWPELRQFSDVPPPFINPSVWINGAIADALRQKINKQDIYFNPQLAREFEMKFDRDLQNAINADDNRILTTLTSFYESCGCVRGNARYWQSHDCDVNMWNM